MSYDPRKWYGSLYGEPNSNQIENNFHGENVDYDHRNEDDNVTSEQYDPCIPALDISTSNSLKKDKDPRKLETYISMLQKFIRPLSPEYKRSLPYDIICQLANSMLDGTVFEIAKGLKDIQAITEKNLSQKRLGLLSEHRTQRNDMKRKHLAEVADCQNRTHQLVVLEKRHSEEKKKLKDKCDKELLQMDQKIVLEIDQKVSDQQLTLERAGLPLFFITNNPEDVKLQMYVLDFVLRLSKI